MANKLMPNVRPADIVSLMDVLLSDDHSTKSRSKAEHRIGEKFEGHSASV